VTYLFDEKTGRIAAALIALVLAAIVKAVASVLRTWIEQASRTRRLAASLEGTKPYQRPGIIVACSHLEGSSLDKLGDDKVALPRRPSGLLTGFSRPTTIASTRRMLAVRLPTPRRP
jgi:hypothetical protein